MVRWLARLRDAIKRIYAFCNPLRFTFLAVAILAFAFWFSDQGWDILRALVETSVRLRLWAFLVVTTLLALEVWYWSRHLLRYRPHAREVDDPCRDLIEEPLVEDAEKSEDRLAQFVVAYVPRILGLMVFIIEIVGLALVKNQYRGESPRHFWVAIIALVALAAVYWIFVTQRRRLLKMDTGSMTTTVRRWRSVDPTTKTILMIGVAVELGLFVWALLAPVSWWVLGAPTVLVLTIAVWIPLGSTVVGFGERVRVPILSLLLIWAIAISSCTDNHRIRELSKRSARRTLEQAYIDWRTRVASLPRDANGKIPVIVVATEGGGIRAAYWTATVLATLQDTLGPSFADHLFAISGVSGGSVGATAFDALIAHRAEQNRPRSGGVQTEVRRFLQFDALSGTLASLAQPDFFQRFFPAPASPDRAAALEEGWETGWDRGLANDHFFSRGLLDLFAAHPDLPVLFLNGTTVELGDRIITTPVEFRPREGYAGNIEFRDAHDAFQKFGPDADLRLSTSALMSARFTYVSPAGKVPNRFASDRAMTKNRDVFAHVVDGGYFENSGAVTASEVVSFLASKGEVQPYVIVIDYWNSPCTDGAGTPTPFCPAYGIQGPPPPDSVEKWMNEVMSPVRSVLAARGARGVQAVGDVVLQSRQPSRVANVIEFRLVPNTVPLPLGWVLSDQAMDAIDNAIPCAPDNRAGVAVVGSVIGARLPATMQCRGTAMPMPPPKPIACDRGGCPSNVEKGEVQ